MSPKRLLLAIPVAFLAFVVVTCATNLSTAVQRSRQKRTMAVMRDLALRIEAGKPAGTTRDAWGTPMIVRVRGAQHYSIRAAMRDRKFQSGRPYHPIHRFDEDIVLIDGAFAQAPEGL